MARTLFGPPDGDPQPKPSDSRPVRMQMMITVKAAPNPSERYGETVCVAGIRAEMTNPGWIRLYPINFRDLPSDEMFRKYQLITLEALPARGDQRRESFRPILPTIVHGDVVEKWRARRAWLDDYLEDSMCRLNADVKDHPDAKSLSLIRPREVSGMRFEPHPGWSLEEQRKIDRYVSDAAWADLARIITYKQHWRGGQIMLVDRWFASTKTCSVCHTVVAALPLQVRVFTCPACGHDADRDLNAAANLAIWAEQHDAQIRDPEARGPVINAFRGDGSDRRHRASVKPAPST